MDYDDPDFCVCLLDVLDGDRTMRKIPKLEAKKRGDRSLLYTLCSPVDDIEEVYPFVMAMIKYVIDHKLDGLAANQVGLAKQIFVTDVPGDHIRVFINPIVTITDHDMEPHEESCCSYMKGRTRYRHAHVIVDHLNLKGERLILDSASPVYPEEVMVRLAARVQHEMEHLLGLEVRQEPDLAAEQTALCDLLLSPQRVPSYDELDADLLGDYISQR